MKDVVRLFKLLADETRFRILMLLAIKELCVCQVMGVLGISQPLVSRNLALLSDAGLLNERREGKLVFYSFRKKPASVATKILEAISRGVRDDSGLQHDLRSLSDCREFQEKTGKCDMKTFLAFMEEQRRKRHGNGRVKRNRTGSGPK